MEKILVTGANGFLGQHLCLHLNKQNFKVVASGKGPSRILCEGLEYEETDLTDEQAVTQLITKHKPDVIIHNAALSKPDECNTNKDYCLKVNVESTRCLLNTAPGFFIYISTDFIFGENGPHKEDSKPDPLNFYGDSKLQAEMSVRASGIQHAIVRPVFIYGNVLPGQRPSFLHWVKFNLEQGKKIKVVSDQLRTPTYVYDICTGITSIIHKKVTGDFHLAGKDIISPYQMAVTTANVLGLDASLIENVTSETFPEPVKRAKRSGLVIDKAKRMLG